MKASWGLIGALVAGLALAQSQDAERLAGPDMGQFSALCEGGGTLQPLELSEAVAQSLTDEPQLIMAREDAVEARADAQSAVAAFWPTGQAGVTNERYVANNPFSPVVVIGNTVLGGSQTRSAYASLNLSWNLLHSGRDISAYRGAREGVRAATSGIDRQLDDTLSGVLQAYAELYEAQVAARGAAEALTGLKAIHERSVERFENGHGTTVAVGQARAAALEGQQTLNRACRTVGEKSAALAQAVGVRLPVHTTLAAAAPVPVPVVEDEDPEAVAGLIDADPAVVEAKDKVDMARSKLGQSRSAFGPSLTLTVQRDYLGQDVESFGEANHHIRPNDYWVGLTFQQPLFPFISESAEVRKAGAEVRKAQASYERTRLEVQGKLASALGARRETQASYLAARSSLAESRQVLVLTESQYRAGRTDLDSVEHARMDVAKASAGLQTLESQRALASWGALRALQPSGFPSLLLRELHLFGGSAASESR